MKNFEKLSYRRPFCTVCTKTYLNLDSWYRVISKIKIAELCTHSNGLKHFQNVKKAQTCLESLLNFWWVAEEFLYYKWQVNGSDLLNFVVTCSCIKAINAPGTQICYTLFLKRKQMFSFELKKYLVRKKHTLKRSFAFVFLVLDMYVLYTTWMYFVLQ